ncbi:hypothetical protein [Pseudomonas sp. HY13-MNA-CIBAN-0226]|uniref:hypothetical protein n=1 Tax=Pseudomonas sp. HY13-MNA-CIBAN-0226 TaxID=3140473 RepID=UPI00331D4948
MIEFACKNCEKSIRLSYAKAGSSGLCPHCRKPVTVPAHSDIPLHDDVFVEIKSQDTSEIQVGGGRVGGGLGSRAVVVASTVLAWFFGLLFVVFFFISIWSFPLASLPALAGAALLLPPVYRRARIFFKIDVGVRWKVMGSVVLFICYMMMYSYFASNAAAERNKLAGKQAEEKRQAEREQTTQYLRSNKAAIQAEANALIDQGKIEGALGVVRKYQGLGDPQIDAVFFKAEVKRKSIADGAKQASLLESLAALKADNISERARIYEQLTVLAPENADYKKQAIELKEKIAQTAAKKKAADDAAALKAHQREMGLVWRYGTHKDEMTQMEILTAQVDSTNTLSFDFPYSGLQRATLELRKHPRWGSDVILQVERGQFLCNSYDGCSVNVRFGNGKPQRFWANQASDNSTTYIFVSDYGKFVNQLRKAGEVVIEASFYQAGNQAMKFSVEDLDWK